MFGAGSASFAFEHSYTREVWDMLRRYGSSSAGSALLRRRSAVALVIGGAMALLALTLGAAAQNANSQGTPTGNRAFSAFYSSPDVSLPNGTPLTLGTLDIPQAGSYVVNARVQLWNSARTDGRSFATCSISPRRAPDDPPLGQGDADVSRVDLERDRFGMVVMQFAQTFDTPGAVLLRCGDGGTSKGTGLVKMTRAYITAMQVDSLTKTRFVP
jgi:hypothetical protein